MNFLKLTVNTNINLVTYLIIKQEVCNVLTDKIATKPKER